MSDAQNNSQQNTLEDVEASTETKEGETVEEPKSRQKRSLIDVPTRSNVGADGSEIDEFK